MTVRPPRWMESILRLLLDPVNAETVSGDLIEEYRESIYARKGKRGADLWFLSQVAGFASRSAFVGAVVLAILVSGRFAYDTFAPPADWGPRSALMVLPIVFALGSVRGMLQKVSIFH